MKNYYIGLPAMKFFGNYDNLDYICQKYKNNIDTWYTTPSFGKIYHTRENALVAPNASNFKELKNCIDILKKNNQKIQFTFNSQFLRNMDISYCKEILDSEIELYGKPDSIVALDFLLPLFSYYDIPLTYSFNNYYQTTKFKNIKYCNTFVVGNSQYIRNIPFIENIKNRYNVKIELLVNNGCHRLCDKECYKCSASFQQLTKKMNYIDLVAEQTLFPKELQLYPEKLIDYYKVSCRPCTWDWLDTTLNFYTNYMSIYDIMNQIDLTQAQNWLYISRYRTLIEYLQNFEPIDIQAIINKKYELWGKKDIEL